MMQSIAVLAVLALATTPAIARGIARRRIQKDPQIDVAGPAPGVDETADATPPAAVSEPPQVRRSRAG